MKKRTSRIVPLLLGGILLTSCTNQNPQNPTPPLTPAASLVPSATNGPDATSAPEPTEAENTPEVPSPTPEPTLEPTAAPTPEPTPIPTPNLACMYVNYANSFPIVVTNDHSVTFHFDDTVTVTDANGYFYEFSLSQRIFVEGLDLSDPDLWYFCGAFQSNNIVYAHFDYLNNDSMTPSLLIKIDLHDIDADTSCCILTYHPQKHIQDNFAVTNDYIYYTNIHYNSQGTAITDLLRTDKNGENSTVFYEGTPGETIPYITCDGNYLSYVIADGNGTHHLASTDLSTGEAKELSDQLPQPDFLIGWNGYVFTSIQNGCLTYFDCTAAEQKSIVYTGSSSILAGYPLTDGKNIYLPLISYSGDIATTLLSLDLAGENILAEIHLDDTYYYSVGMIDEYLYVENVDSFIIFDITQAAAEHD